MNPIILHQFAEKLELRGYAKRTITEYRNAVACFFHYLTEQEGVHEIAAITPAHLSSYHGFLRYSRRSDGRYLSVATVALRLVALRTFYTLLYKEKLIAHQYGPLIALPRVVKGLPKRVPGEQQMQQLLSSVQPQDALSIRDRCMLELLYATAIRNDELCRLTVDSIDISSQMMRVVGKGGKERVVPVGAWVVPYVREYLLIARPQLCGTQPPVTNRLFLSKSGTGFCRQEITQLLQILCKKAGISPTITPHGIRHACATHLLKHGADIRYVQELLGHALLSTTQIYTKVEISWLQQAHGKFHPREQQCYAAGH